MHHERNLPADAARIDIERGWGVQRSGPSRRDPAAAAIVHARAAGRSKLSDDEVVRRGVRDLPIMRDKVAMRARLSARQRRGVLRRTSLRSQSSHVRIAASCG